MKNSCLTPRHHQIRRLLVAALLTTSLSSLTYAAEEAFAEGNLSEFDEKCGFYLETGGLTYLDKDAGLFGINCMYGNCITEQNGGIEAGLKILKKYADQNAVLCMSSLFRNYTLSKTTPYDFKFLPLIEATQKLISPSDIEKYAKFLDSAPPDSKTNKPGRGYAPYSPPHMARLMMTEGHPGYNPQQAADLFKKCILMEKNHIDDYACASSSAYSLAKIYKDGNGLPKDEKIADKLFELHKKYDETYSALNDAKMKEIKNKNEIVENKLKEAEREDSNLLAALVGAVVPVVASGGAYVPPPSTYSSGSSGNASDNVNAALNAVITGMGGTSNSGGRTGTPGGGIDTGTPYDNSRYSGNNTSADNSSQRSGQGSNQNSGSSNSESTDFSKGHPEMNASHCLKIRRNPNKYNWPEIVNTCNREVRFIFCGIPKENKSLSDIGLCPGTPGHPYASFGGSHLSPGESQGLTNPEVRMGYSTAGCFWKDDKGKAYMPSDAELVGDRIKFKCKRW